MFRMVNSHGNVQKNVRSEAKRDELLKEGWKPVEEPKQPKAKNAAPKQSKAPADKE